MLKVESQDYYFVANRLDHHWGHGIKVSVYNHDHMLLGKLSFRCHPEFGEFELYQSYDTDKLVKIASERIAKGFASREYSQAWNSGLELQLRFNSPNA